MLESLLREWDGETVIVRYDRPAGTWIVIAIIAYMVVLTYLGYTVSPTK